MLRFPAGRHRGGLAALLFLIGWAIQVDVAAESSGTVGPTGDGSGERRYVPVQIRRGSHDLPSLASEVAPRPGELREYSTQRHHEYVPVQPLGVWSQGGSAEDAVESPPGRPVPSTSGPLQSGAAQSLSPQPPLSPQPSSPQPSSPQPASVSAGRLYVLQLAAFRQRASLDRFVAEHRLDGVSVRHVSATGTDGSWWILTYGEYPSLGQAQVAAEGFAGEHGLEVWVRPLASAAE